MNNNARLEELKELGLALVTTASFSAITLNVPLIDKFPVVANIDMVRWDYFITIACVWVGLTSLDKSDISASEKEEIRGVIMEALIEKCPKAVDAINDCAEFMERTLSDAEGIEPEDALGSWMVWNMYRRVAQDPEERQIIKILGGWAFENFGSWWEVSVNP